MTAIKAPLLDRQRKRNTPAAADDDDQLENSPIEQVSLTVPATDDPSLPAITFRTWTLGALACLLLSVGVNGL
ncbi:Oligopeptide transporter 7 [Linum perenne]